VSISESDQNADQLGPFRFKDRDNFVELTHLISRIPPSLQEGYLALESTVSQAFLAAYSKYLTPEQIEYFSLPQIIYSDFEIASIFDSEWDDHDNEPRTDSNLGGLYYTSYTIGSEARDDKLHPSIVSYNAGKFAVFPLRDDEVVEVHPKWLKPQAANYEQIDEEEFSLGFNYMKPYVYSNGFGRVAIHEKVHGVQVFDLPLPIREAAAMYYERQIYLDNGWDLGGEVSNMRMLSELYGEFVARYVDEAHLFMFGNMEDVQRKAEILDAIKNMFNPEKIEEFSKYSYDSRYPDTHKWVYWKTEPFKD